jgi:hypothetical protein
MSQRGRPKATQKASSGPRFPEARTWESLIESESVGIDQVYDRILLQLAVLTHNDKIEEGSKEEASEVPDLSSPSDIMKDLASGKKPGWWPTTLDRVEITIRGRASGFTPVIYGPSPFDPNTKDFGRRGFISITKSLCESLGVPFAGMLEIEVSRKKDRRGVGAWKSEVMIGEASSMTDSSDPRNDAMTDYLTKELRNKDDAMLKMFTASSSVIQSSAAALNAMRGVNAAPPWMQEKDSKEDSPFWMQMAGMAMEVAMGSGLFTGGNQQIGQAAGKMMNMPMRGGGPGQDPRMIGMQGGPPPADLGYDQYMGSLSPTERMSQANASGMTESGEYDGYFADESDLLDDNFQQQPPDVVYQERPRERAPAAPAQEESFYEEYEDNEEGSAQETGGSANPLDGRSPEEVASMMEAWLDSPEGRDKSKVTQLGKRLLKKIM